MSSKDINNICVIVSCDSGEKDSLFFADLAYESIDNKLHEKIMKFSYVFKYPEFTVKKANVELKNYISNIIKRCKTSYLREIMFGYEEDVGDAVDAVGSAGSDDETDVRKIYMRRYPELYHTVKSEKKALMKKHYLHKLYLVPII
jgi:hypothetical protein